MMRITMHLKGAKQIRVDRKTKIAKEDGGGFNYFKKTICYNTITSICNTEEEGLNFMSHYLDTHRGIKVTKHYFTNIK